MLTFVVSARDKLIGDHLLISEKENSISLVNLPKRFPSSLSSLVNLPSYFSVGHCTAFIIMALTVASASPFICNMILSIMVLTVAFAFPSMFDITLILCIVASIIIMALTVASASPFICNMILSIMVLTVAFALPSMFDITLILCIVASIIIMALTLASASPFICNMILSIMVLTVAFAFPSMFNITLILCIVASIIIMALKLASASTSRSASAPSNSASTSSSASAPSNSASPFICNMILSKNLCIVAFIIIMALTVASDSPFIFNMILSIMVLTVAFAFPSMFNITLILCIVASIIIMALKLASASTSRSASAPSNSASTSSSASAPSNSASTSSSASAPSNYRYDVFLNHYGDDVKNNFASHLYRRLLSHGLQVFLDQPEMQRGEKIEPQIEGAIATASVQVAIFSPRYAASRWCLDELVLMLRSMESGAATVIPVFFKVTPSELRWTNARAEGLYAEAIANHEKKERYTPARIAVWREVLAKASYISGYELERCKGDEGELVEQVARQVLRKARLAPLHVATHPIGLDEELQDFERTVLLEKQQNRGPPIILITGSGGVGKTTLVKAFFNKYRSHYERCCFLAEVRDSAVRNNLTSLQGQLCKDLNVVTLEMRNIPEGIGKLEQYCSCPQSLVILDDVDSNDQLDALLSPVKDRLPSGSLILVTSRDKSVLSKYAGIEEFSIYHMKGLGRDHSQQLFCWHSFNRPHPAEGYEELVGRFLDVCNGLPLSLKVIGSLLRFESREDWEARLRKLTQVLPLEIQNTLMISYDSLDPQEQEIFIDSACFFIGIKAETAIRVWFGSGWEGSLGLQTLQNKCLVEIDSKGCIKLHDHLRDLGRNLADKGSLGCGIRMWGATDNCFRNVRPQSTVRGISMVPPDGSFQSLGELSNDIDVDVNGLQLLRAPVDCLESLFNRMRQPKLVWLRCEIYERSSLPSWILLNNSECSLPSWIPLKDLRVLEVVERVWIPLGFLTQKPVLGTLWLENKAQLPLQLRELNICVQLWQLPKSIGSLKDLEKIELHDFQGTLPEGFFYLRSLKYLKLRARNERMNQLSESFGNLKSLLHLDLSGSEYLQMLPSSLGNLTQLQHMNLSWCKGLQMLPPSLGDLRELQHMNLSGCKGLQMLPPSLGDLRELQHMDLSWCKGLQMLPPSLGDLRELQHMDLSWCTSLQTLPESFMNLIRLKYLDLSDCHALTLSGEIFGNIGTLIRLNFSGCDKLEELPHQVTHQQYLKELILDGSNLKELPSTIGNLGNLEILSFSHTLLETLPHSFGKLKNLKELKLRVRKLDNFLDFAGQLKQLTSFSIIGSPISEVPFASVDLVQAGGRRLLDNCMLRLKYLDLSWTRITEISFGGGVCPALERLHLLGCQNLVKVGALPTSLTSLILHSCFALRNITGLRDLKELRVLSMGACREVEELSILGVWELNNLEDLNLVDCPISVVPFASVEEVQGARRLSDSSIPNCMPRLNRLSLSGTRITEISFGEGVCPVLQHLDLRGCKNLVEVGALPTLLKSLYLTDCGALKRITGLSGLEQLELLYICSCGSIEELPGLETLISLTELRADKSMKTVLALAEAANHRVKIMF